MPVLDSQEPNWVDITSSIMEGISELVAFQASFSEKRFTERSQRSALRRETNESQRIDEKYSALLPTRNELGGGCRVNVEWQLRISSDRGN